MRFPVIGPRCGRLPSPYLTREEIGVLPATSRNEASVALTWAVMARSMISAMLSACEPAQQEWRVTVIVTGG